MVAPMVFRKAVVFDYTSGTAKMGLKWAENHRNLFKKIIRPFPEQGLLLHTQSDRRVGSPEGRK